MSPFWTSLNQEKPETSMSFFKNQLWLLQTLRTQKAIFDSQKVLRKKENGRKNDFLIFDFIT